VFFVGVDEANGAGTEVMARAVDGELDGAFAYQPHFGMRVMVRRMWRAAGRQRGLVRFEGFAGGELALNAGTDFGAISCVRGDFRA
jgi:hypothetical protein